MNFKDLGLSEQILKNIATEGYEKPTPIQQKAIPAILKKLDVMAAAQTGTGKTAAFTLPLLENLRNGDPAKSKAIRALILTPTRELACQVAENIAAYSQNLKIKSTVAYGGVPIAPQIEIIKNGIDILVATPGRLGDLYGKGAVKFDKVETIILDEADRMLDLGFFEEIKDLLDILPPQRQSLLFSATFSKAVRNLAQQFVKNPIEITINPEITTASSVKQWIHPVDEDDKYRLLAKLIYEGNWSQVLVFTNTRVGVDELTEFLVQEGIQAVAIHSNKPQTSRTKTFNRFKEGSIRVLVATDIAARGLDIEHLPHVINFTLPKRAEDYVHRIGRTGRAGATGEAISLVSSEQTYELSSIERLIKKKLERIYVPGYTPKFLFPEDTFSQVENDYFDPEVEKIAKEYNRKVAARMSSKKGEKKTDVKSNSKKKTTSKSDQRTPTSKATRKKTTRKFPKTGEKNPNKPSGSIWPGSNKKKGNKKKKTRS